jgi:Predicted ATPase/kinase involved in NAD metabolism
MNESKKIRIVITGPESTGKTTLATQLAQTFNGLYVAEYAREYVEHLTGQYTYADVEAIARKQIDQYAQSEGCKENMIFFDTWLIITKVWFEWVFGSVPVWIEEAISEYPIDLYLLCRPDLPWEPDAVRENGGENRIKLFEKYKEELIQRKFNFVEISGEGDDRIQNAVLAIKDFLEGRLKLSVL